MDREGASHAPLADTGRQDGVVGGVEHRMAEPGDHREQKQLPVDLRNAEERNGSSFDCEAADQDPARADPVHEKPDRRLGDHRRRPENRVDETHFQRRKVEGRH